VKKNIQAPSSIFKHRRGQAVLEYVLLMAVIFIASTVMISFIRNGLFGAGLAELPNKVSACLSHGRAAGTCQ
jgi:uncharacterized protein (UPF0333 family)